MPAVTEKKSIPNSLSSPYQANELLAPVVGDQPIARSAMVKAFWAYVNGVKPSLKEGRFVNPDKILEPLFATLGSDTKQITSAQVMTILAKNSSKVVTG